MPGMRVGLTVLPFALLLVACSASSDDAAVGSPTRPSLPTSVTTAGAGTTATLNGEQFVVVLTLPASALSAERLESVGEAQGASGERIAMAKASASGVQPWELVSVAGDGWRVWEPAVIARVLADAGPGASVSNVERVDWPDACLGIDRPGELCAAVITAGYRIIVDVNGQRIEYHTDLHGNFRLAT